MLSRANSDAGSRLRRAKSTSSVHPKSYEPQSPLVDHKHAEVAAVEAYRRARKNEQLRQPKQTAYPHPRRGHVSHRSEGSHFEDSRSGNRLKTSQSGFAKPNSTARPRGASRTWQSQPSEDGGEQVVVKSRRFGDTTSMDRSLEESTSTHIDQPNRRVHKTRSMYTPQNTASVHSGEEMPRRSSVLPDTPYRSVHEISDSSIVRDISESQISTRVRPPTRETQTEDEIKTAAWDAYLQGFHKKHIRERKSFVAPIKRRLSRDPGLPPSVQYDSSVPPYNFADDSCDLFSAPVPPVEISQSARPGKLQKKRVVSESLKSKFKRILGMPKRVQSSFPAQHVEAKNLHFDVYRTQEDSLSADPGYELDLPKSRFSSLNASGTRLSSAVSQQSGGDASTVKSRVTSWTNSTTAGTVGNSGQGTGLRSIDESSTVEETNHAPRGTSGSFLGQKLRLPLGRRQSQADLSRSSENGQKLYDALRKRIQEPEECSENSANVAAYNVPHDLRAGNVKTFDTGPAYDNVVPDASLPITTIRAVSPEVHSQSNSPSYIPKSPSRPPPSPPLKVARKPSWWNLSIKKNSKSNESTEPQSLQTKKEFESAIAAPSKEQIASRVERSETRWQATLENRSSDTSMALQYSIKGTNPYELSPLNSSREVNSLPMAIRHGQVPDIPEMSPKRGIRKQVISPSVYSRASGCRSVSPNGRLEGHGMFITITGHEVKRYSLDSPPKSLNGTNFVSKPSHEWKSWLNKELEDMNSSTQELSLSGGKNFHDPFVHPLPSTEDLERPSMQYRRVDSVMDSKESLSREPAASTSSIRNTRHVRNRSDDSATASKESLSRPEHYQAYKPRRPEMRPRTSSSIMNERYPLIQTKRPPSRGTGRGRTPSNPSSSESSTAQRKVSESRPSDTDTPSMQSKHSADIKTELPLRPKIRERQSTSALARTQRHAGLATHAAQHGSSTSEASDGVVDTGAKSPKSALDLRVMYRSRGNEPANLNIRRKGVAATLLEDQTLKRISEGPYAADVAEGKENNVPYPRSKTEGGKIDRVTIPPFYGARQSPSRGGVNDSGMSLGRSKESPGQRMVDEFLSSRNSVGLGISTSETPAFI